MYNEMYKSFTDVLLLTDYVGDSVLYMQYMPGI